MRRIVFILSGLAAGAVAIAMALMERPTEVRAAVEPGAPEMVDVRVPPLDGMAATGRQVFAESCAVCHGPRAGGHEGLGPPLVHRIYEPGHHGDMAFLLAARQGVRAHHWRFGDMPPVPGITQDEIAAVIAYVRSLQRANGIY